MKVKKLIALLLVAATLIGLLAGCGKKEDEPLEFYFISLMSGGAAWSRAEQGFNDACKEFGVNGHFVSPVERNSMVEMASLLEQAVTQQADAAFGVFASAELFGPALTKAKNQGMVTASVQLALDPEYIDFMIGSNQTVIAEEMAQAIIDYAGDQPTTVMFLCGSAGEMTNIQFEAFEKKLEGHDNITSLGMRFDEGAAATANQVLSDEHTAHPELNAVVCLDSSAATIGAASFIQEKGLEDEWTVIGIDASADILNYVKAGALDATLNQDFYQMGYGCVKMAYEKIVNGVEPEFINDSGCYLIRPEDVDDYAAKNNIDLG